MKARGLSLLLLVLLGAAAWADDAFVLEAVWVRCANPPEAPAALAALAAQKSARLTPPLVLKLTPQKEAAARWNGKRIRVPTEISEKGKVTRSRWERPHNAITAMLAPSRFPPSYLLRIAAWDSVISKAPATQAVGKRVISIPQFNILSATNTPFQLDEGEWKAALNTETSAPVTSQLLLFRLSRR